MMFRIKVAPMLVLALMLIQGVAIGRTWRVEKDGNGDYTTIQPALDASAPGDTVLIGSGRFLETEEVTTIGWAEEVYAAVWNDSISIIGSGVGETIIGPEVEAKQLAPRPKGIFGGYNAQECRIEHLTIENIRDGIYWNGGVDILGCVIRGGWDAIKLWPLGPVTVTNVICEANFGHGIIAFAPGSGIALLNCQFSGSEVGVSIVGVGNVTADNCLFSDHIVGVQYDSSFGTIGGCRFIDTRNAGVVLRFSDVELRGNHLTSSGTPISIGTFSHLSGSDNIVLGGSYATLDISGSTIDFHGNHIMNGGGLSVLLEAFLEDPQIVIDLSGNYWDTTEADSISAWILDGHDDPDIHAIVEFEPFSPIPLPTEQKSMGDIKRMFR